MDIASIFFHNFKQHFLKASDVHPVLSVYFTIALYFKQNVEIFLCCACIKYSVFVRLNGLLFKHCEQRFIDWHE